MQAIECNLADIHPTDDVQARMMATEQEVRMIYVYRAANVKTELVDHYCQAGVQLRAPEHKLE